MEKIRKININILQEKLETLLNKNFIKKMDDIYIIDLQKLGFDKLLSNGKPKNKFKIKVKYASKKAVAKIKENGGEVELIDKNKMNSISTHGRLCTKQLLEHPSIERLFSLSHHFSVKTGARRYSILNF